MCDMEKAYLIRLFTTVGHLFNGHHLICANITCLENTLVNTSVQQVHTLVYASYCECPLINIYYLRRCSKNFVCVFERQMMKRNKI